MCWDIDFWLKVVDRNPPPSWAPVATTYVRARELFRPEGHQTEGIAFKKLTRENWLERDPTNEAFHRIDFEAGVARPLAGDDWADAFLAIELSAKVPDEI